VYVDRERIGSIDIGDWATIYVSSFPVIYL